MSGIHYETNPSPDMLLQLESWFGGEWPNIDALVDASNRFPKPIVAITDGQALAGGLAFTIARTPDDVAEQEGVWINAVLVDPTFRRQGIASTLITQAEQAAALMKIDQLWVLTDVPSLYTSLGWEIVGTSESDTILSKRFNT